MCNVKTSDIDLETRRWHVSRWGDTFRWGDILGSSRLFLDTTLAVTVGPAPHLNMHIIPSLSDQMMNHCLRFEWMLSKERERDWCRAAKSYNCVTSVQINWRKFKDNKLELYEGNCEAPGRRDNISVPEENARWYLTKKFCNLLSKILPLFRRSFFQSWNALFKISKLNGRPVYRVTTPVTLTPPSLVIPTESN